MKKFNQNQKQTSNIGESDTRPSVLSKLTRRNNMIAGAAILAVIVLHFVSQFVFFQGEKLSLEAEAISQPIAEIKPENAPDVEIKTESEAKTPEVAEAPDATPPGVQPEPKNAPSRVVVRKKESRESRAGRLRRAERILTGI
jgi:type IV secretory pathway VirB10-like protein